LKKQSAKSATAEELDQIFDKGDRDITDNSIYPQQRVLGSSKNA